MIYEQLNISIPKGRLADLDDYARKQGQTLDGAVNKILRNALGLSEKEWNAQTEIDPRIADLPEGVQIVLKDAYRCEGGGNADSLYNQYKKKAFEQLEISREDTAGKYEMIANILEERFLR